MNSILDLIGNDVEFLSGIEQFDEYLETGMRGTILHVAEYPEKGLFEVFISYMKYEQHNLGLETSRFYSESATLETYRTIHGYHSMESFCVTENFPFFQRIATVPLVMSVAVH